MRESNNPCQIQEQFYGNIHLFPRICDDDDDDEVVSRMESATIWAELNAKITPNGNSNAYEYFIFIFVSVNIVFVMRDHKNNMAKNRREISGQKWCSLITFWMDVCIYIYTHQNNIYIFCEWEIFNRKKTHDKQTVAAAEKKINRWWNGLLLLAAIRCNIYKIAHFKFRSPCRSLTLTLCRSTFLWFWLCARANKNPHEILNAYQIDILCSFRPFLCAAEYESLKVYWYDFVFVCMCWDGNANNTREAFEQIMTFFPSCCCFGSGKR